MADAGPAADLMPRAFQEWFAGRGWAARSHQLEMVAKGRAGRDALLIAPTGGAAWISDLVNGDAFTGSCSTPAAVAERTPSADPSPRRASATPRS